MALQYQTSLTSEMLIDDIEKHVIWYNEILRKSLFPSSEVEVSHTPPNAFVNWCRENITEDQPEYNSIARVQTLHQELSEAAHVMLERAGAITKSVFDTLEHGYEAYITQLRKLQQDVMTSGAAIDPVTGLHTVSNMYPEVARELDRSARKGGPFCLAHVLIDKLDDYKEIYDRREQDVIYASVAAVMTKMIRSFDDAYFLGQGEYIICLKQVDKLDACSVMERLCDLVRQNLIKLPNMREQTVTISCGVTEPVPEEEKIEDIFKHAKMALGYAIEDGGDRVEQYYEMSRLEQYAKDQ